MSFYDPSEAGHGLAAELVKFKGEDVVAFALPRDSAPVAIALDAPLDLILVRKIGVPFQPELAMGAVADGGTPLIVRDEDVPGERKRVRSRLPTGTCGNRTTPAPLSRRAHTA